MNAASDVGLPARQAGASTDLDLQTDQAFLAERVGIGGP